MSRPTPLGMPAMPPSTSAPPWKTAWDRALYGDGGFFRRERPADHFRTSPHASELMAEALLRLARRHALETVVDVGAGGGELLRALHDLDPSLHLVGVEVASRPEDLPDAVRWTTALPARLDGLVVANEWLDNVPCHVLEVDDEGRPRLVHVDPATGRESLGAALDEEGVPASLAEWVRAWWPLAGAPPGARAEVGTTRDRAWSGVVRRVHHGVAVAVDYGHVREDRPLFGSLRSYLHGREVDVVPDGSRDVTAHVAMDSVAASVGATVQTQGDALADLGVSGRRPPLDLASSDPAAYVRALARASEAAELTAPAGLGAFYWVVSRVGC